MPVAADTLELSFYGNSVNFHFDPQWKKYRLSGGDKPEAMSAFWTMMSGSKYEPAIESVNAARRELKLDDWGYVALWRDAVQALLPERKPEQNLLLWYFLVKSGYDVRLGYAGADVHLFRCGQTTGVLDQVYQGLARRLTTRCWPLTAATASALYTYEASYPVKLKPLDIASASTGFTKPRDGAARTELRIQGRADQAERAL